MMTTVTHEINGNVGVVTLAKPPHNLIDDQFIHDLVAAYDAVVAEGDSIYVQAVIPGGTKTEIWERSGRTIRDDMMDATDLVDAALVGFDRREAVTIPSLHQADLYEAFEGARQMLLPHLNNRTQADRYRL